MAFRIVHVYCRSMSHLRLRECEYILPVCTVNTVKQCHTIFLRLPPTNTTCDCATTVFLYFARISHLVIWWVRARLHVGVSVVIFNFVPRSNMWNNIRSMCECWWCVQYLQQLVPCVFAIADALTGCTCEIGHQRTRVLGPGLAHVDEHCRRSFYLLTVQRG